MFAATRPCPLHYGREVVKASSAGRKVRMSELSQKTVAFVMDPLGKVNIDSDTSFALMVEAQKRGYQVVHVNPGSVSLVAGSGIWLRGRALEVRNDAEQPFSVGEAVHAPATDFSATFIRTDPPFDEAYLNTTWLLSFAVADGAKVVNDPRGIRNGNEKLYALEFSDLCPETIVTASLEDVRAFLARVDGQAVAKPLDGHGGFGVMRLRDGDSNVNAIVETLSGEGAKPIIVQRYLPEASEGDKRLFMLDGELAAVLQRTPAADDHRGNVHVGGSTSATDIGDEDRAIAARLGPRLKEDGILFAGLDVIAGKLIEINVTSPTLVQELRNHGGPDLAVAIIDKVLGA